MAQKAKEKNTTAKKSGKSRVDNTVKNPNEQPEKKSLEKDNPIDEQHTDQVEETGSVLTTHKDSVIHCLTIIGQIEGHYILPQQNKTTKYEHVIPLLVSIEEDERIDGLLILINTVGIPLAVAADKSFIAPSASMTVHPVRTTGLTLGVPQTFEYFQRMQDRITTFVAENSDISKERYNELVLNTGELVMDIGTILEGEEAVSEGLIDEVGTVSDAIDCLYTMIKRNKTRKKRGR